MHFAFRAASRNSGPGRDDREAVCYRPGDGGQDHRAAPPPENVSVFVVFLPCKVMPSSRHRADDDSRGIEGRGDADPGRASGSRDATSWRRRGPNRARRRRPSPPRQIAGPWTIRFTPGWAPESSVFETHPLERASAGRIRFFSGSGTYRTTFELGDAEPPRWIVPLGQVGNIATVRVNSRDLGVVWTDPWSIGLTVVSTPDATSWRSRSPTCGSTRQAIAAYRRKSGSRAPTFACLPGEKFRHQGFSRETPDALRTHQTVTLQFGRSVVQSAPSRGG